MKTLFKAILEAHFMGICIEICRDLHRALEHELCASAKPFREAKARNALGGVPPPNPLLDVNEVFEEREYELTDSQGVRGWHAPEEARRVER